MALALASEVPATAGGQVAASRLEVSIPNIEVLEHRKAPPPERVSVGDDPSKDQFKRSVHDAQISIAVQRSLAVIDVEREIPRPDHIGRLLEVVLRFVNFERAGVAQCPRDDGPYAHIIGRGLSAVIELQDHGGRASTPKALDLMVLGHKVGAKLAVGRGLGDLISGSRFLQRPLRLSQRDENQDYTYERKQTAEAPNQVGLMRSVRRFFSGYGGAPLSAQIGGIVIFGLITGIGIVAGIGGIIRRRLDGWLYLAGGLSAYGLFLWWSSPA